MSRLYLLQKVHDTARKILCDCSEPIKLTISNQKFCFYIIAVFAKFATNLFSTGIQEVVVECHVRFEKVCFDSSWWLHCHFGAILQDGYWELGAGHAGQPKTKVSMHLSPKIFNIKVIPILYTLAISYPRFPSFQKQLWLVPNHFS